MIRTNHGLHTPSQSLATQVSGQPISDDDLISLGQTLIRNEEQGLPTRIPSLKGWQLESLLKFIKRSRKFN